MDSLDTLYLMGLHEEFEKAKEWVKLSLDFDRVGERRCVHCLLQCQQWNDACGLLCIHSAASSLYTGLIPGLAFARLWSGAWE